jgi:hypothetical protein
MKLSLLRIGGWDAVFGIKSRHGVNSSRSTNVSIGLVALAVVWALVAPVVGKIQVNLLNGIGTGSFKSSICL